MILLLVRKLKWALLLIALPFFSVAQCPLDLNIKRVITQKNTIQIIKYIDTLQNCELMQDSLALLYHKLGGFIYRKSPKRAIEYTQKALSIRDEILSDEHLDFAFSYYNLGIYYIATKEYKDAIFYFKKSAKVAKANNHKLEMSSYYKLGTLFKGLGDFNRSLQILELGIQKAKKNKNNKELSRFYLTIAYTFHEINAYEKAINYLIKAEIYYSSVQSKKKLMACYRNLARSFYGLGKFKKTIFYSEKEIKLRRKNNNIEKLGDALNSLGLYYLRGKYIEKAQNVLEESLSLAKKYNLPSMAAHAYDNFGEVALDLQQNTEALGYFHKAIQSSIKGFSNPDYTSTPTEIEINKSVDKQYTLVYLTDKAKALFIVFNETKEQKYLTTCLETYKRCNYIIDFLRQEHTDQISKLFWREKVLPIYEKAIEASYVAKDYDSAFFFFEKSKAILLLDAMLHAEALNGIKNDKLILQEKKLRKIRLSAQEELDNANESEKKTVLEKIIHLNNEWDALTLKISEDYPNYHAIKYEKTATTPLTVRKGQLKDGKTALLHYFLGKEKTWLYVLSKEKISIKKLGTAKKTATLIRNYLSFFENPFAIINDPKAYEKAAFELYKYLLAPAELLGMKNLIIIPDGILGFVPFEALITKPSEGGNLSQMNYLIKEYSLRLSFSATILDKQNNNTKFNQGLLAFAPFSEVKNDSEYAALPFSADELSAIKNSIGGQFYKGKKATKGTFLNQMANFSIIHLSTHATANANDGKPFIVFSDSLLTLQELYGLHLSANLVVLSACETNIGEVKSGEGIFSLSRGFTYAGAKSIIASLWNVNTGSTGEIFPGFYENLKKGDLKSNALRKAKLDYINAPTKVGQVKTPYDWAGFVLVGNNENVSLAASSNTWIIWSILGGIILLILVKKFVR